MSVSDTCATQLDPPLSKRIMNRGREPNSKEEITRQKRDKIYRENNGEFGYNSKDLVLRLTFGREVIQSFKVCIRDSRLRSCN